MRRPTLVTVSVALVTFLLLPLATNLATGSLPSWWHRWLWLSWPATALLAVIVVGAEVHRHRAAGRTGDGDPADDTVRLDRARRALAESVGIQWAEEAAVRGLRDPDPLWLWWSPTGRPVAAHPAAVLGDDTLAGRPVRLRLRGDLRDIASRYRSLPRGQLVVLGEPGSGKSVLAMLLTLGLLAELGPEDPVPVLLSVSSWHPGRDGEHLQTWIARRLAEDYPFLGATGRYGPSAAQRLVHSGRVLPILDGLDEIPVELHTAAIRGLAVAVADGRPLVVTCRSVEYQAAVAAAGRVLPTAAVVELESVDLATAEAFLSSEPLAAARWRPVLAQLRGGDAPLARALSSPLMVWLARTVYTDPDTDPAELLDADRFPDQQAIERRLLDGLLPASYARYPHSDARSDPAARWYDSRQAGVWLTFLAGHLTGQHTHDFAWWRFRVVRWGLRAPAAVVFGVLSAVAFGEYAREYARQVAGLPGWPLVGLAGGVVVGLLFWFRGEPPAYPGPGTGGTATAILGRAHPVMVGLWGGLFVGVPGGLIAGLVGDWFSGLGFGLAFGLAYRLFDRHRPRSGRGDIIRHHLVTALIAGPIAWLVAGLAAGFSYGSAFRYIDRFPGGLAAGSVQAARSALEYGSVRQVCLGAAAGLTVGLVTGLVATLIDVKWPLCRELFDDGWGAPVWSGEGSPPSSRRPDTGWSAG